MTEKLRSGHSASISTDADDYHPLCDTDTRVPQFQSLATGHSSFRTCSTLDTKPDTYTDSTTRDSWPCFVRCDRVTLLLHWLDCVEDDLRRASVTNSRENIWKTKIDTVWNCGGQRTVVGVGNGRSGWNMQIHLLWKLTGAT